MIDFRYHLVSIVAVLLALAVGIVVGSGVGDPLANLVAEEVGDVRKTNRRLLERNIEQDRELEEAEAFQDVAGRWIIDERLQDREVVILEMEGTDRGVVASLEEVIARAGGRTASKFILSSRFALQEPEDRELLANILGSRSESPGQLRSEAAAALGGRVVDAGARPEFGSITGSAEQRLVDLVADLEEAGFIDASQPGAEGFVPTFSSFLVLGGSDSEAPFNVAGFARDLVLELSRSGAQVMAGETSTSRWQIVERIREDAEAQVAVSTVDQIETGPGRVAAVLVLEQIQGGEAGHFGVGEDASRVLPEPPRS